MTSRRTTRLHLVAGALLVALASGCSQQAGGGDASPAASSTCACEGTAVVDPALLAFLSKVRSAHHQADLAEAAGQRERAIEALEQVASGPKPKTPASGTAPEVAEVLADTLARLADLRSAGGDFDRAGRDVEQGLSLATTPTHFRGHLVEMRGVIEERRSIALKDKGDQPGAEQARRNAIAAFEQAIEIQDQVIQSALGDAGSPAGGGAP
jgi:tetratricopeptide (TPR) repeat protein